MTFLPIYAIFRSFCPSQWSTPKSGPLAGAEAVEKGAKGEKSYELVDHFEEWTTSWVRNCGKWRK